MTLSWLLIALSALFDSYAAFVVKSKFNELGPIDFSSLGQVASYLHAFVRSPQLLSAVMAFVAAPALWFFALNRMNLSVGYPALVAFHLLFVLFFGIFFLAEHISLKRGIGILLVLVSLYFLHE